MPFRRFGRRGRRRGSRRVFGRRRSRSRFGRRTFKRRRFGRRSTRRFGRRRRIHKRFRKHSAKHGGRLPWSFREITSYGCTSAVNRSCWFNTTQFGDPATIKNVLRAAFANYCRTRSNLPGGINTIGIGRALYFPNPNLLDPSRWDLIYQERISYRVFNAGSTIARVDHYTYFPKYDDPLDYETNYSAVPTTVIGHTPTVWIGDAQTAGAPLGAAPTDELAQLCWHYVAGEGQGLIGLDGLLVKANITQANIVNAGNLSLRRWAAIQQFAPYRPNVAQPQPFITTIYNDFTAVNFALGPFFKPDNIPPASFNFAPGGTQFSDPNILWDSAAVAATGPPAEQLPQYNEQRSIIRRFFKIRKRHIKLMPGGSKTFTAKDRRRILNPVRSRFMQASGAVNAPFVWKTSAISTGGYDSQISWQPSMVGPSAKWFGYRTTLTAFRILGQTAIKKTTDSNPEAIMPARVMVKHTYSVKYKWRYRKEFVNKNIVQYFHNADTDAKDNYSWYVPQAVAPQQEAYAVI